MANIDAVNYAKKNAVPSEKIAPGDANGFLYHAYDEVTLLAELAVNDIIRTGIVVPAGARVVEAYVISPSLGATGILQLGTAADPDALIAAADAGGQAIKAMSDAGAADLEVKLAVDTNYQLKCTEVSASGTGKKIQVAVIYSFI